MGCFHCQLDGINKADKETPVDILLAVSALDKENTFKYLKQYNPDFPSTCNKMQDWGEQNPAECTSSVDV